MIFEIIKFLIILIILILPINVNAKLYTSFESQSLMSYSIPKDVNVLVQMRLISLHRVILLSLNFPNCITFVLSTFI